MHTEAHFGGTKRGKPPTVYLNFKGKLCRLSDPDTLAQHLEKTSKWGQETTSSRCVFSDMLISLFLSSTLSLQLFCRGKEEELCNSHCRGAMHSRKVVAGGREEETSRHTNSFTLPPQVCGSEINTEVLNSRTKYQILSRNQTLSLYIHLDFYMRQITKIIIVKIKHLPYI